MRIGAKNYFDMPWDGQCLIKDWKEHVVDLDCPGVYLIVRESTECPDHFLWNEKIKIKRKSCHREFSDEQVLRDKWVDDEQILYIGTTTRTIKKRLCEYMKFGLGNGTNHKGGRYIWVLPDHLNLTVLWKILETGEESVRMERELLEKFKREHDNKLPFANMKSGNAVSKGIAQADA